MRMAHPDDALELAELVNYAGEGLPLHVWKKLASAGKDPWEIGRQRQAKRAQSGQIVAIESGGRAVAALTGYAIPEQPGPIPDEMPAIFRPLQELENLAPLTWHVNVIATMPDYRRRGFGKQLLDTAEAIAQSENLNAMSLIVKDANRDARRLYERAGYREAARRLILKEDWQTRGQEWVLMVKRLPQGA